MKYYEFIGETGMRLFKLFLKMIGTVHDPSKIGLIVVIGETHAMITLIKLYFLKMICLWYLAQFMSQPYSARMMCLAKTMP